ncbi:SPOR domain-containing protein [Spongorhabdus nitratireducens]
MTATRKKPGKQGASRSKSVPLFQRVPGWMWLITGLLGGFLLALLIMLAPGAGDTSRNTGSKQAPDAAQQPEQEEAARQEPVFDFYKLLPESEVIVSEPAKPEAKTTPKPQPAAASNNSTASAKKQPAEVSRYLLQTGSFRSRNDAERLRAQLILWGLDARIQQIQAKNGEYWHRVQVGPLTSMTQVNSVQKTLADHKVDSLLLKLK